MWCLFRCWLEVVVMAFLLSVVKGDREMKVRYDSEKEKEAAREENTCCLVVSVIPQTPRQ